ncbi:MAG: hypothetical protein J5985_08295 [Kiritimatiellae bacterium]|nr:hypothetical protein [Kiritimatiellia bacterium]
MMKNVLGTVIVVVVGLFLWKLLFPGSSVGKAVDTAKNNADLALRESVLPENDQLPSVIRKAELERREKENREWTTRNIQARPDLYLDYCWKMLNEYHSQYRNAIMDTKVQLNQYKQELEGISNRIPSLLRFLQEAGAALSKDTLVYPVKVGRYTYANPQNLEKVFRKTDGEITELQKKKCAMEQQIVTLELNLKKLEKGAEVVKRELDSLPDKVEMLKAKTLQDSAVQANGRINELLARMKALADNGEAEVGEPEEHRESVADILRRRGISK